MFDYKIKEVFGNNTLSTRDYYKFDSHSHMISALSTRHVRVIRQHRTYGPASLEFDGYSRLVMSVWRKRGAYHRTDGPAIVHWVYDYSQKVARGIDPLYKSHTRPLMLVEIVGEDTFVEYEFIQDGNTIHRDLINSWKTKCNIACLYNLTEQEKSLFKLTFMSETHNS